MNDNFINLIKENGIVGAGGAGFPTHVKLNAEAEFIVINGAECEPLLRVDQQLMGIKTNELLISAEYVRKFTKAKRVIIGLKSKYKNAVKSLKSNLDNYPNIQLLEMENFYPAGDEQILVYEATGRIVPEGGIPLNVGVIVLNVETLINIYESLTYNKPVTHKYITVTGQVRNPVTVRVPIGITIKEVIDIAGGTDLEEFEVINGGPMMGKIISSLTEVVTKTTKGLIILPKDHSLIRTFNKDISRMLMESRTACMHCNLCTEVCPRNMIGHNMEPHKLIRIASYGKTCDENLKSTTAFLCCECRLCQYACVMELQPWKLHKALKEQFSKNGIKNPHHNIPSGVHPFREYKKYPVSKLIKQLGLSIYDVDAPLMDKEFNYSEVKIQLRQHIGASTTSVVHIGQQVEACQTIGVIDAGKLGANIHSSISGIIKNVTDEEVTVIKEV